MGKIRTLSSLRNPVYRLYYGGLLGQMSAMNMQLVVRSLLIYRLTNSPAILGAMAIANAIPMLLLSLFGGVIAERKQKKYVLLIGQACSAVVSLAVALTLSTNYLSVERAGSWWILIVAAIIQGTIMGLMMPSRQAIIAEIVSAEQLMNAVALNALGMNLLRFFMPALAGFLIDFYGFDFVYYTMAGMYLMAVIFIAFIPTARMKNNIHEHSALADIKDGLRYVLHEPTILLILSFTLVIVVLSRPYQFLLPVFTEDILKVGATEMGVLLSVSGIGAMIGSILLASLPNRKRGIMLLSSSLLLGLILTIFAFSQSWHLSLILIIFVGFGDTGRMTLANTLLQYYVDDEYRGRVMSILMMEFGIMSIGTFFAGLLAEVIGVQWSVGGLAIGLTFISIIVLFTTRRLRQLE